MLKTITIDVNSELTAEQHAEIEAAKNMPIVFDEDCEELSPELQKAFKAAVGNIRRRRL